MHQILECLKIGNPTSSNNRWCQLLELFTISIKKYKFLMYISYIKLKVKNKYNIDLKLVDIVIVTRRHSQGVIC